MDWLLSRRYDRFRYVLVDRSTGQEREELDVFESGGIIDYNDLTSTKVSGRLPFIRPPDIGFDYLRVYSLSTLGAAVEKVPHGTFLVSNPNSVINGKSRKGEASIYSLLQIAVDSVTKTILSIPSGTNVISYATNIFRNLGLSVVADSSSATSNVNLTFDAGTPWLEIANKLCEIAGFSSSNIDAMGTVRLKSYTDPSLKAPTVEFNDDLHCIYRPDVEFEFDIFSVPNVVLIILNNEEETLIAVAENRNPASMYSVQSRGREIYHVENVSDIDGLAALQALAERRLSELTLAVESRVITHTFIPFEMGDVVRYNYGYASDSLTGVAVSQSKTLTGGIPCRTKIRKFIRG